MNGDLENAIQVLAADNARLCEIGLAADAVVKAAEELMRASVGRVHFERGLKAALEAYKVVRNGQ